MLNLEERLKEILNIALKYNTSDIHFELKSGNINIDFRTKYGLKKLKTKSFDDKLIRYLQYLANMDVGSNLLPQTGQFEYYINNESLSLRFAVMSSYNITSAVLRILNNKIKYNSSNLSLLDKQNNFFKEIITKSYGLIIFSGPTGSGKTTTLYSLLNSIKNKKIYSIEDPIEIFNDNFVQLQVNEKAGFDYEAGLKQILRHDPDIIMIGEIRDYKAAKMAINAANTGHLVLTTLHASTALLAISRMCELGCDINQLNEVLIASINQRLIKDHQDQKLVLYEILDEQELNYIRENKSYSKKFLSLKKQYEKGVQHGLFKANIL